MIALLVDDAGLRKFLLNPPQPLLNSLDLADQIAL